MSSAASAVIHSVRLISAGLDRADAFVAFRDDRVLATGIGNGWRELAGHDANILDGAGYVLSPGLIDIHNHGGGGASYGAATSSAARHYSSAALSGHRGPRRLDLPASGGGGGDPARPYDPWDPSRGPVPCPPPPWGA